MIFVTQEIFPSTDHSSRAEERFSGVATHPIMFRLQLIITSQKGVAFENINFLPYPIRKLSIQASVTLLKRMVEGFGVEMSDEQAKTIVNLTDGCPLALRIIGTELRSPKMGVPEMIHALTIEM